MTSRFIDPIPQYTNDAGEPIAGGKLYFYDSGTTDFRNTYSDSGLTIANANPVILDSAGRPPNIFLQGNYKLVITDENDVQITERDPVSGSSTAAEYSDWSPLTSYSINNIVRGSDNEYYVSITNNNLGNDPTSTATDWSLIVGVVDWNINETYSLDDVVRRNGILYRSTANSNTGSAPETLSNWASLSPASAADAVVTISGTDTTLASNGNGDVKVRANGVDVARADADGKLYVNDELIIDEGGTPVNVGTSIAAIESDVTDIESVVDVVSTNTTIKSNGNGDVYINANGVNIMRIDANGNVYFKGDATFNTGSV